MSSSSSPDVEETKETAPTATVDDPAVAAASAEVRLNAARSLWLSPPQGTTAEDLNQVETILLSLWLGDDGNNKIKQQVEGKETAITIKGSNSNKRAKTRIDPCTIKGKAGSRLALWLIQSGRAEQADKILKQLYFECRLSSRLLSGEATKDPAYASKSNGPSDPPCRVYNHFLSEKDIQQLMSVFGNISSTYWTDHAYSVEPASPYFSYMIPLRQLDSFGFLGSLIGRLRDELVGWQPLLRTCSAVELWAHNRPCATGHQLHFDTDNEGSGESAVRHPLITCILYLTNVGGPTVVTNQRKASRYPADKGWISHAAVGRMTALDGRILHGVVPGRSTLDHQRRVSLMLAFWRRIKVRDEPTPGAARKFPVDRPWAQTLREPALSSTAPEGWSSAENRAEPELLDYVFEDLNGKPWQTASGLPDYNCIFQGI